MIRGRARGLNDHRNEIVLLLSPSIQALEAVDYLICAVVGGYNADG